MLRIRRTKYLSLLEADVTKSSAPRAWHLLPSVGKFVAREFVPVTSPRNDADERDCFDPFPLVQEQLQDLDRPGQCCYDDTL